ncbi:MAG: hypothetical protein H5T61_10260 [Thermoflexales bacterium]|nr:hypothetical protein [Thermoflexales bacterium]
MGLPDRLRKRNLSEIILISVAFILRLFLIFTIKWCNSSDLNNYFWAAERVIGGENPYILWQNHLQGPRSDLLPLELLLLSLIISVWESPYAIRVFFGLCDVVVMLLIIRLFRDNTLRKILWLTFYGLGAGPLFLFVLTPTDKTLLLALVLLIVVLARFYRPYPWVYSIILGLLAALKWIGLVIAFPVLHAFARNKRQLFCLFLVVIALFGVSHVLWYPDWQIVYKFRASRLHLPPFHTSVALVLQKLGMPMQNLYSFLIVLSLAACGLAYLLGWIDWEKAMALSLWAFVYWTPDCTPQMLLFVSILLLIEVDWTSWKHSLIIWVGMLFHTLISAASVYPIIGGLIDLQWMTNFTGIYGSTRTAVLSQVFPLSCLFLLIKDVLHTIVQTKVSPT